MGRRVGLGLRATPKDIYWAVVENDRLAYKLITDGRYKRPKNDSDGSLFLVNTRRDVVDLIRQYEVECVALRIPEPVARTNKSALDRARVEGVAIEGAKSSMVPVYLMAKATISSLTGSATEILEEDDILGIDVSEKRDDKKRESILWAVAALMKSENSEG